MKRFLRIEKENNFFLRREKPNIILVSTIISKKQLFRNSEFLDNINSEIYKGNVK
jgi:hypothetical protein